MIDLVVTHLTHPWGPSWTLETLGNPWQPLATLGDMLENDHFGGRGHIRVELVPPTISHLKRRAKHGA